MCSREKRYGVFSETPVDTKQTALKWAGRLSNIQLGQTVSGSNNKQQFESTVN